MTHMSVLRPVSLLVLILVSVAVVRVAEADSDSGDDGDDLDQLKDTVRFLLQQLRIQSLGQELIVRSRGNSGLGTKPYHGSSYVGRSVGAIHNHANEKRTIGMGELVAVLNGVEFKTRHNDYQLRSPSRTSTEYTAQQDIDFPEVPPAVLEKTTVQAQIVEMRKWFKAFHEQDHSKRDYRPYFRPTLCYLEGGWTNANDTLREPFPSRRHKIRAHTYSDLTNKFDYETATGAHMPSEDYAYLPRKISGLSDGIKPQFAQWTYVISCHRLDGDLPTAAMVPVVDLAKRMADIQDQHDYVTSRTARFNIESKAESYEELHKPRPMPREPQYGLLDELMSQIPGKDNYPGSLQDISLGGPTYGFSAVGSEEAPLLNTAFYHRLYSNKRHNSATMLPLRRSFSDETMFMAMNSRPEMTLSELEYCNHHSECKDLEQKWTYAIPLEIIYTNPLTNWNPHNVLDRGSDLTAEGRRVNADGRSGGTTSDTAYDGINDGLYFPTPEAFYSASQPDEMYIADTGMPMFGVLDKQGAVHKMRGAGHRILLPKIPGISGRVRIRYPVGPVHEEGSALWKEFAALRDMLLSPYSHRHMYNIERRRSKGRRH